METSAFSTGAWGDIPDVPTAYLNSQSDKRAFRMGFMRDQGGNFVFISVVNKNQVGFDGSMADFEAMLPAIDGKTTAYFAQADLKCTRRQAASGIVVPSASRSSQENPILANQMVDLGTGSQQAAEGNAASPAAGKETRGVASDKNGAAQATAWEETGAAPDIAASLSNPEFIPALVSRIIWFGAGFAVVVAFAVGGFLLTRRQE